MAKINITVKNTFGDTNSLVHGTIADGDSIDDLEPGYDSVCKLNESKSLCIYASDPSDDSDERTKKNCSLALTFKLGMELNNSFEDYDFSPIRLSMDKGQKMWILKNTGTSKDIHIPPQNINVNVGDDLSQ